MQCLNFLKYYSSYHLHQTEHIAKSTDIIKSIRNIIQLLASGDQRHNFYYFTYFYSSSDFKLPNTQLLGCAFHYHQSIYRNIQRKVYKMPIKTSKQFDKFFERQWLQRIYQLKILETYIMTLLNNNQVMFQQNQRHCVTIYVTFSLSTNRTG